uniref:C-type lectin domain-containing protein n=1 Tax=Sinocyclocheilus anshuiensis TaxID=1608454 RepID=A0A671L5E1_9TELE
TQMSQPKHLSSYLSSSGSDSMKIRNCRAAVVCLVPMCVLLLTAVIVLCVHIYTKSTYYTEKTNQLLTKLTEERNELINQLFILGKADEWIYYQFSFYYMSNVTKNWTESRRDCLNRGADLIIINNREEQNFVMKNTVKREFWIGVTDSDVENTWKWVDGSTLTTGFWASKEPNGKREENCAVTYLTEWPELIGWHDVKCNDAFRLICEKSIFPLIQRETS